MELVLSLLLVIHIVLYGYLLYKKRPEDVILPQLKRPIKKGKVHTVSDKRAYDLEQESKKEDGWEW